MLQIFNVTANENARYKRNELELSFSFIYLKVTMPFLKAHSPIVSLSL